MSRRKPEYYQTPLRSRQDIIDFIIFSTHQRVYDHRPHPFCYNVKVYHVDFDFDHLLQIHREAEDDPIYTHNDEWLAGARAEYDDLKEGQLWEYAQEDACNQLLESDAFKCLYDGTQVDVRYSFEGRSGGWLSINRFEGHDFTEDDQHIKYVLQDMQFSTLRKLYVLVTMLNHDVRRDNVAKELEYQAAFNLFHNVCSDVPQPDNIQRKLSFAE